MAIKRRGRTRMLKQGEPVPMHAPMCLTVATTGYVELHWRISPYEYVKLYEHRAFLGNPIGEVHHRNGVKTDNRPENLEVVTRQEHRLRHFTWNVHAGAAMRLRGSSYAAIGREFDIDSATAMRGIKSLLGVKRVRR